MQKSASQQVAAGQSVLFHIPPVAAGYMTQPLFTLAVFSPPTAQVTEPTAFQLYGAGQLDITFCNVQSPGANVTVVGPTQDENLRRLSAVARYMTSALFAKAQQGIGGAVQTPGNNRSRLSYQYGTFHTTSTHANNAIASLDSEGAILD